MDAAWFLAIPNGPSRWALGVISIAESTSGGGEWWHVTMNEFH